MGSVYIRVWEYEVAEGRVDAFVAAYGSTGDWAQLFRAAHGYLGTELYRRTDDSARFVTIDRWTDRAAWSAFLEEWGESYERLDRTMTALVAAQRSLIEGAP